MSRYQKGKTKPDFTEATDSEWQWHQMGHMHVCTSLQTDNHASTPPLKFFLQAGCPSCHPTNSIKALKANQIRVHIFQIKLQSFERNFYTSTPTVNVFRLQLKSQRQLNLIYNKISLSTGLQKMCLVPKFI